MFDFRPNVLNELKISSLLKLDQKKNVIEFAVLFCHENKNFHSVFERGHLSF
jgi:hypothetical protein